MKTKLKFVVYKGYDSQFYWHIKARNGRIIADGSEGYKTKSGAYKALKNTLVGIYNYMSSPHYFPNGYTSNLTRS